MALGENGNAKLRLREWRTRKGLSARALGERVGDTRGYQTGRYERDPEMRIGLRLASRLAEETGLPLLSFLHGEPRDTAQRIYRLLARDLTA